MSFLKQVEDHKAGLLGIIRDFEAEGADTLKTMEANHRASMKAFEESHKMAIQKLKTHLAEQYGDLDESAVKLPAAPVASENSISVLVTEE